jgi:hypothetical protein
MVRRDSVHWYKSAPNVPIDRGGDPMRGGGSVTYDTQEFAGELDAARANGNVGTMLWFENEHVRVWEVRLEPGQRAPFHSHSQTYFWTCIDPGKGFQRFPDGTAEAFDFGLGETVFNEIEADDPMIHDLENRDDRLVRFVAIELKDL